VHLSSWELCWIIQADLQYYEHLTFVFCATSTVNSE
jgi:hypothetical protein